MSLHSSIVCTGCATTYSLPVSALWRRVPAGGFPEGWAPGEHYPRKWARRFAVDFVGGDLKAAAKGIEPVITLSSGKRQIEIL